MERNQNYVELWGVAAGEPVFSHENHTRRFDKFPLRVERLSGQNDVPVIVASEALLRVCPVDEVQSLRIVGQLRSFNNKSGQGNRLVITVFAQSIEPGDGSYFNRILLFSIDDHGSTHFFCFLKTFFQNIHCINLIDTSCFQCHDCNKTNTSTS